MVGTGASSAFPEGPSPEGKHATDVAAPSVHDVALASNGDLLVAHSTQVWRIGPDGVIRVAAGNGRWRRSYHPTNGDGGPAVQAMVQAEAIAALGDGGFLIAENEAYPAVRRVWSDGTITTVAGGKLPPRTGGKRQRLGDGGPATNASVEPLALAVTPDGGYLVLEQTRVRRVAPDGTITTVAGTGVKGFSGDGGPAVRAQIDAADDEDSRRAGDIAVTADGGFLIADMLNHRIRRVAPDGRITTVAGDGRPMPRADGVSAVRSSISFPVAVAATPDGGFAFFEERRPRLRRVGAHGTITTVVGRTEPAPNAAGVPVGDGGPARDALLQPWGRGLVSTPAGGWIFTEGSRVRLVTPGVTHRLDAAVVSVIGRASAPVVHVSSTAAGATRITLSTPKGRVVASATQPVAAGDASIRLPPVKPGPLWLDLRVSDPGGRYTSTRLAVVLGSVLPEAAARHAVKYRLNDEIEFEGFRVGTCSRVNRRRIDCEANGPRRCHGIHSVTLRKAFTFLRRYGCRAGLQRSPRWLEPTQPWPTLAEPPLG